MARHGGGSRSGGSRSSSSRSRSRSGSRSGGGSSYRSSTTKPFRGCYDRSYYYKGRRYRYYTNNANFGAPGENNKAGLVIKIIITLFITFHMCLMLGGILMSSIQFGSKIDGNPERIGIVDSLDILTDSEEAEIVDLFERVYEKSGMPITLVTDDMSWQYYYDDIETYSEELYYAVDDNDEEAMLFLFTIEAVDANFTDWNYDICCGDDTYSCLSDATFDKLIEKFQKAMARQDLAYALNTSFEYIMDDLAKTTFNFFMIPIVLFVGCFYGIFYFAILGGNKHQKRARKYFEEHPEEFNTSPMVMYSECPNCGAKNTFQDETCPYCGTMLKLVDDNVRYIRPGEENTI